MVALIGGQKLKWFDFEVNQKFIDGALVHLEKFWELVQTNTPPEVDGSDSTADAIARLYGSDDGSTIDLDEQVAKWVEKRAEFQEQISQAMGA